MLRHPPPRKCCSLCFNSSCLSLWSGDGKVTFESVNDPSLLPVDSEGSEFPDDQCLIVVVAQANVVSKQDPSKQLGCVFHGDLSFVQGDRDAHPIIEAVVANMRVCEARGSNETMEEVEVDIKPSDISFAIAKNLISLGNVHKRRTMGEARAAFEGGAFETLEKVRSTASFVVRGPT